MTEPSLSEQQRAQLYARLAATGDVRPGSINATYRKCGKQDCACARPGHPGHRPRWLWTRSAGGRTRSRQLAAEVDKVRAELPGYGDIGGICRAARAYPLEGVEKEELHTALGYYENNAPRMRYRWFRQCGLFAGLRCRGGELHDDHRPAPQIIRHALDRQRGRRNRHPALPPGQLPDHRIYKQARYQTGAA